MATMRSIHNVAMFVIAGQLALVYFWAAFYKISGSSWRDGTALFHVLTTDRYTLPWISTILLKQPFLLAIASYSAIIVQIGIPFLLWNRRIKLATVLILFAMHMLIAFIMGLVIFSAIMIVADCALVTHSDWAYISDFLWQLRTRLRRIRSGSIG